MVSVFIDPIAEQFDPTNSSKVVFGEHFSEHGASSFGDGRGGRDTDLVVANL